MTNNVKTIEQLIKELSEQEKVALDGFITDCLTRAEEIKKRRAEIIWHGGMGKLQRQLCHRV